MGTKTLTKGADFFRAYKEGWPFKSWKSWTIKGLGGDDTIYGGEKGDRIDGGSGADRMYGGKGDDIYDVDHSGDRVIENAGEGIDTVHTTVLYPLPANVENLYLHGSVKTGTGNGLDNLLVGNEYNNKLNGHGGRDHLVGYDGNDVLDGGPGADIMAGGSGNDIYKVDNYDDSVFEYDIGLGYQGYDTVHSYLYSYILPIYIEELELQGNAYYGAGNSATNVLKGSNQDNHLFGAGGYDILIGNAGRDILTDGYFGANESDHMWGDAQDYSGGYADTFLIGNKNRVYYQDGGDAHIYDFSSQDGDKINLGSSANRNLISLVQNQNLFGGPGLDTQVLYNGNRVAILYDTTDVSVTRDFLFG